MYHQTPCLSTTDLLVQNSKGYMLHFFSVSQFFLCLYLSALLSFPPDNLSFALCGPHYIITTTATTTITLRTLCALHYRRFVAGNPALHYRNFATILRYSVLVMTKTKIRFVSVHMRFQN